MWQLDNRTPFAAERTWVRDRDGAEVWLVAVKATFHIQPDGSARVADEQPPVNLIPAHHGKPGQSSLRHESDLQRTKLNTDIVVLAQAHAPGGKPVESLDVGFAVASVVKMLKVFGDRVWQRGAIGPPQPFVSMPIVYERLWRRRSAVEGTFVGLAQPCGLWVWPRRKASGGSATAEHRAAPATRSPMERSP